MQVGNTVTIITPNYAGEGEIGVIEATEKNTLSPYDVPFETDLYYYVRLESGELTWAYTNDLMLIYTDKE